MLGLAPEPRHGTQLSSSRRVTGLQMYARACVFIYLYREVHPSTQPVEMSGVGFRVRVKP